MTESFPRRQARTHNFTLGVPRSFQIAADGSRIVFLRSQGGNDPQTCLWALDLPGGSERLVADPAGLGGATAAEPEEELARRERSREQAGGIVAFSTDAAATMASFALAGDVYVADLAPGGSAPRLAGAMSPAIDPRPDPAGARVSYVCDGALRVTNLGSGEDVELVGPDGADGITFGLAEFVAAEEMGRMRGYWWAPDSSALLVARVDETGVNRWHIADPANPGRPPAQIRYPAAGTPNACVSLIIVRLDGTSVPVRWDAEGYSYLAAASWVAGGPLIVVQSRDQRRKQLLAVDPVTGTTSVLREDYDALWLDLVPGVPARIADGAIVWTVDAGGARRLLVAREAALADGTATPVTPPTLQVRSVASVDGDTVLFSASGEEPTEIGVWTYGPHGLAQVSGATPGAGGVQGAVRAGGTTVLTTRSMADFGVRVDVLRDRAPGDRAAGDQGAGGQAAEIVATISSLAEQPGLPGLRVSLLRAGQRELRTALLLPSWHVPGSAKLPVLMDPYGGPHSQRVLASAAAFLTSQWFADQGFAVIVADGRGTPGRGPEWDRAIAGDLAGPILDDQVEALADVARRCADDGNGVDLDLTKVAIRGWSFGGYLAALAVLRRPDVFHAAVAGAPVTDWRLYDTHYTERYLGHPDTDGPAYDASSLPPDAHRLTRPLLIVHGLADDNVVVAHTLRLSSALLAAGRPHYVLPLSGVTHMTSQEEVAENLLLLQVNFLRTALGLT